MYIPTLSVRKIDPAMNAKFITNFLSKEKRENTTRPFYDKTIELFPELECISRIDNETERNAVINEAVVRYLSENNNVITDRMAHFKEVFNSFIYQNIKAQCELFEYKWSERYPEIVCYVGYLPFYPRSAEEKCFYVSYHDEERVFSGAVHEINHMIFWEKWKEISGTQGTEPAFPDPLWYLEEIIVDPTLNDERVRRFTLYENRAYPQFYVKKNGLSIMDRVKVCYASYKDDIAGFLKEAYEIVLSENTGK